MPPKFGNDALLQQFAVFSLTFEFLECLIYTSWDAAWEALSCFGSLESIGKDLNHQGKNSEEREGDARPADGLLNTDLSTPHQCLALKCWKLESWMGLHQRETPDVPGNAHLSLPNESPGEIHVIKGQQV